jgi:DUF4097 and DUF4098 domain-containing protein YvlB
MRRRSLIGPLLLVLIGLFFLLENLRPDWVSFDIVSRYWPFLLIVWGVLRLLEVLFWKLSRKPLPSRGVSGGEWTLIVFICLIGTGLFLIHGNFPSLPRFISVGRGVEMFGEAFDFPVAEQRQPASATRIIVENLRGNTRIIGSETQEIKVAGRKTIRAYRQSEADEANRRTTVEILKQGDQILVRAGQEQGSTNMQISSDLDITVPAGSSIQATGRSGDFDILSIRGDVEVRSDSAGVRLQDIGGKARVDVRRGNLVRALNVKGGVEVLGNGRDVELENVEGGVNVNGSYSGNIEFRNLAKPMVFQSGTTELRFERLPGRLNMGLGNLKITEVVGPLRLTARSKDVQIEELSGEMEVSVERGDVTFSSKQAPAGKIDVTTRSGDVELLLPAGAGFEVDAMTHRGEATSAFGESVRAATEGQGATLKGSTGKGPKLTIRTDRGKITLGKR